MYKLQVRSSVNKTFERIGRKDYEHLLAIERKTVEILSDPYRFKPLKHPFQGCRRVHIYKSFVLIYSIDENNKTIIIESYGHHDEVYKC